MNRTFAVITCATLLLAGTAAHAQDKPRRATTLGYPAAIGFIWRATDRVAIRPEIAATHSSTESTTSGITVSTTKSTSASWTVGISGLFFFSEREHVGLYFSPRWTYGRLTSDGNGFGLDPVSKTMAVTGSLGAECSINTRFSIFGEVGFGYSSLSTKSSGSSFFAEVKGWTVGIRTGAGVALYF
jgi:hypothetical protein